MTSAEFVHRLSYFEHAFDNVPKCVKLTWARFCDTLLPHEFRSPDPGPCPVCGGSGCKHCKKTGEVPAKWLCPAFSAAFYSDQYATRSAAQTECASLWMADLDELTDQQLEHFVELALSRNWAFMMLSTWSHGSAAKTGNCMRAVFPLSREVSPREWKPLWHAINSALGALGDPKCKDISRLYFGAYAPEGAEHLVFSNVWEGEPIDVDAVLVDAPAPSKKKSKRRTTEREPSKLRGDVVSRDQLARLAKRLASKRNPKRSELGRILRKVIDGESFAPKGDRDNTIFDLSRPLAAAFPDADPMSIAKHFAPSLQLMADEADECPTFDDVAYKVERAQWEVRDKLEQIKPADDDRGTVVVGPDIDRVADDAAKALSRSDLFQRDGRLARIVRVADADIDRDRMASGTPKIAEVPAPIVREALARVAHWEKFDGEDFVRTAPPKDIAAQISERGEWPLPSLVGITETPILRPDGSVFTDPGYDTASGFFHNPSGAYELPEPTHDNAKAALAELADVWCDFKTASEAERFVPVAAALSIVARPLLDNAPLFAFDAPSRGSGKTLAIDTVSILATGRASHKLSFPSGEEQEKVLGALALRGARVVVFDNATAAIGGDALDRVLTSGGKVALRVLGRSEVPEVTWTGTLFVSGNQLAITGDTRRRTIRCRIVPGVERPGERPASAFKHYPLEAWCAANRERLVAAGLTVLRAFLLAGRPAQTVPTRGSFETWCSLVASAIVWAGGPDVVSGAWVESSTEPEEREALHGALARWWRTTFPDGATARRALDRMYGVDLVSTDSRALRQEAVEAVRELAGVGPHDRVSASKLGLMLRQLRDQVVEGLRFSGRLGHGKVTVWTVETEGVVGVETAVSN